TPRLKDRLPPGQVLTTKWPVLHYGDVPKVDTSTWTFEVSGLVDRPFTLTYTELLELPRKVVQCDIHCVTRWSRLDNTFEGVAVQLLLERAGVKLDAHYCLVSAEQGFTTNLPLTDLDRRTTSSRSSGAVSGSCPSTAGPPGCSCRTCISGRARSGYGASRWSTKTCPASGSRTATTCGAIRGRKSGTGDGGSPTTISIGCGLSARGAVKGDPCTYLLCWRSWWR